MSYSFNKEECHDVCTLEVFGLVDGEHSSKARIATTDEKQWLCKVLNPNNITVDFWAIDHCINILREDGNQESSCDCMITYPDNVVLIELKNKSKHWMEEGIIQLAKSLDFMVNDDSFRETKYKRAFVSNRRHPHFHVIENETQKRFYSKYKVKLDIQFEVAIKVK